MAAESKALKLVSGRPFNKSLRYLNDLAAKHSPTRWSEVNDSKLSDRMDSLIQKNTEL